MPQREDEKCKAHAVSEKADNACKQRIRRARKRTACPKSNGNTDRSGNQPLELDNLQRIGK